MNPLQRILVEKACRNNGWEVIVSAAADPSVQAASALHEETVRILAEETAEGVFHVELSPHLAREVALRLGLLQGSGPLRIEGREGLCRLLDAASRLARSLPVAPYRAWQNEVERLLAAEPGARGTEREAEIRARVGQELFRRALLDFWGGACALSGLDLPELVRASHIKPWAQASDVERLDVYNGLLLEVRWDALFDAGLVSFEPDSGALVWSPRVPEPVRRRLNPEGLAGLRFLRPQHRPFLEYHRVKVFQGG